MGLPGAGRRLKRRQGRNAPGIPCDGLTAPALPSLPPANVRASGPGYLPSSLAVPAPPRLTRHDHPWPVRPRERAGAPRVAPLPRRAAALAPVCFPGGPWLFSDPDEVRAAPHPLSLPATPKVPSRRRPQATIERAGTGAPLRDDCLRTARHKRRNSSSRITSLLRLSFSDCLGVAPDVRHAGTRRKNGTSLPPCLQALQRIDALSAFCTNEPENGHTGASHGQRIGAGGDSTKRTRACRLHQPARCDAGNEPRTIT